LKTKDDHLNQLVDDLKRYQSRVTELERQLADLANGKLPAHEQLDADSFYVESIVSFTSKQPRVVFRWFTHYAQLSEAQARGLAFQLLEVCEAGISDSFIFTYLRDRVGIKEDHIATAMLMEFRQHREKLAAELRGEKGEN
jgi:hypothetical protein